MHLEPLDRRHLTAAEGYMELGMALDASEELESVSPEARHSLEVLVLRAQVYAELERWELLQTVAKHLALSDPDEPHHHILWAEATRRVDCLEAARLILIAAVERHPEDANIHYHLACYESQLGDIPSAKARLRQTFALDPGFRGRALDDEDMQPLWESMRE